eukprot:jgi/Tetstr1/428865/TSEL_018850.t2
MRSFATFCEQEGLRPLQATTSTIVRYTAWLGMQGTVGAESLQQYYSSINKYFRDHQRQPVALGEMVADARRGLAIQQERLAAEDVRVALPAPVAADILNTAIGFRQTLVYWPSSTGPPLLCPAPPPFVAASGCPACLVSHRLCSFSVFRV